MRKTRYIIIALTFCLLTSISGCSREGLPERVMDSVTMVSFLTEAYQIEGYSSAVISTNPDSLGYRLDASYSSLFSKYGITPSDYDSSVAYYVRHPKLFESIYKQVVSNLKENLNSAEGTESFPVEP